MHQTDNVGWPETVLWTVDCGEWSTLDDNSLWIVFGQCESLRRLRFDSVKVTSQNQPLLCWVYFSRFFPWKIQRNRLIYPKFIIYHLKNGESFSKSSRIHLNRKHGNPAFQRPWSCRDRCKDRPYVPGDRYANLGKDNNVVLQCAEFLKTLR